MTTTADAHYATVSRAIEFLRANVDEQPSLADVAAHVGMSEFHLNRVFGAWAGITPKRFVQCLTKERATQALRAQRDVLDAALTAGLSGPGRLHDLMVQCDAVTPGEVKALGAGLVVRYGRASTPFGSAFIAETARGVCKLSFVDDDDGASSADALAELTRDFPAATIAPGDVEATAAAIFFLGGGDARRRPLHLLVRGTNFQIQVWQALLRVPAGALTTYGALARVVGVSGGARAVGNAVGKNPLAFLIPCHRVIREGGALGGYRWGAERKAALVGVELAQATA